MTLSLHISSEVLLAMRYSFVLIGMLSRLLGDPIYESYARRAIYALWKHRNTTTDLFSNDINIETGRWVSKVSKPLEYQPLKYAYRIFHLV